MQKKPPRYPLAVPYLAFLSSAVEYGDGTLRVHLVARGCLEPSAHVATCGTGAHPSLWYPTRGANPAFSRRFTACRKCAHRHPPHFENIPRTL